MLKQHAYQINGIAICLLLLLLSLSVLSATVNFSEPLGESLYSAIRSSVATPDGFVSAGHFIRNDNQRAFAWVTKLSFTGDVVYNYTYGLNYWNYANSIMTTSTGGFFLSGGTIDRSASNPKQYTDCLFIKLNSTGGLMWNTSFGGVYNDYASFAIDLNDSYLVVGSSEINANGSKDAYVLKVNLTGGVIWSKTYGSSDPNNNDEAYSVVRSSGGFTVLGYTVKSAAVGPLLWLFSLDPLGNLLWENTYGTLGAVTGYAKGSLLNIDNELYIATSTATKGSGGLDVWLLKTDSDGKLIWEKTFGGANDDLVGSMVVTETGLMLGCTSDSYAAPGMAWLLATDIYGNVRTNVTAGSLGTGMVWSVAKKGDLYFLGGSGTSDVTGWSIGYALGVVVPSCGPGEYQLVNGTCGLCEPGTYQSLGGMMGCVPCPPGTYGTKYGSVNITDCLAISLPPGTNPAILSPTTSPKTVTWSLVACIIVFAVLTAYMCSLYTVKWYIVRSQKSSPARIELLIFYGWTMIDICLGIANVVTDIIYAGTSQFYNGGLAGFCILFIVVPVYLYLGYTVCSTLKKHDKSPGTIKFSDLLTIVFPFCRIIDLCKAQVPFIFILLSPVLGEVKVLPFFQSVLGSSFAEAMLHIQVIEAVMEGIPEFVIQVTNSQKTGEWTAIAVVSVVISLVTVIYVACKSALCYVAKGGVEGQTAPRADVSQVNHTEGLQVESHPDVKAEPRRVPRPMVLLDLNLEESPKVQPQPQLEAKEPPKVQPQIQLEPKEPPKVQPQIQLEPKEPPKVQPQIQVAPIVIQPVVTQAEPKEKAVEKVPEKRVSIVEKPVLVPTVPLPTVLVSVPAPAAVPPPPVPTIIVPIPPPPAPAVPIPEFPEPDPAENCDIDASCTDECNILEGESIRQPTPIPKKLGGDIVNMWLKFDKPV